MIEIPIVFNSDKKGYLDRECPNKNCLYTFKIHIEDWKEKVSDEEVHCPMCGHVDISDKWWTQQQLEDMQKVASNWAEVYIQEELNKIFKDLERNNRNNKFLKITYNSERRVTFINNPLGQSEEWEQEIICPNCQTRYSVVGSAYFCPCCGFNLIENMIDESLDIVVKMINSLPEMEMLLAQSYGKDKASTMCRTMLEGSLGDVVSAFQKFAEVKYKSVSNKNVKVNDFQNVEKGSKLFEDAIGKGYSTWLNDEELLEMNLVFQKRHIIEHNGGMIDEMYIKKSNDTNYCVGQRIVIHNEDTMRLIQIIKKLNNGLKTLTVQEA